MKKERPIDAAAETGNTTSHDEDSRETLKALELTNAQISMTLQESEDSVDILISAITAMAGCVRRIENTLPADDSDEITNSATILKECSKSEAAMQQATMAFQFYDRLSQRLLHIQQYLHAVADVIEAPERQHHSLWQDLHDKVSSLYSLEQEQRMYQALLNNLPAEEVIQHQVTPLQTDNDIELF